MVERVYQGDARAMLPTLAAASVDAVVTDPPAGVGFMGVAWDSFATPKGDARSEDDWDWSGSKERPRTADARTRVVRKQGREFRAWLTPILAECLRVLKPGGHALVWALPRTSHWTATALEDAGFEIRDCITHLFGQGFPKSHNLTGDWDGWGTALKPGAEFWWVARAPLSEPTVAANVARWGTGALNIDGGRLNSPGNVTFDRTAGRRSRDQYRTGTVRGTQIPSSHGRWPPNIALSHTLFCEPVGTQRVRTSSHSTGLQGRPRQFAGGSFGGGLTGDTDYTHGDGTETVEAWACAEGCPVALLDGQAGPQRSGGTPARRFSDKTRNAYGKYTGEENPNGIGSSAGQVSRFFYVAKSSAAERSRGLPDGERNQHPTVKPLALMRWLLTLVVPPGGVVLDPFAGSGSTLVAAAELGIEAIGIEQSAEYCATARQRLRVTA